MLSTRTAARTLHSESLIPELGILEELLESRHIIIKNQLEKKMDNEMDATMGIEVLLS